MQQRYGRIRTQALLTVAFIGVGGATLAAGLSATLFSRSNPSGAVSAVPVQPAPAPQPKPPSVDTTALENLIDTEARKIPGDVSIHVRFITGEEAGYQAEVAQPAASVIKLPIMAVLFDAWEQASLPRTEADLERIRKAITQSDNPATNALIERLGQRHINEWLDEHGYVETRVRHKMLAQRPEANTVSAAEMTRLLTDMAQGRLVSSSASEEMQQILLAQQRRTRIPAQLPAEVQVGNKTGTLRGIIHDVALIYPPERPGYALAVLVSNGGTDAETSRAIARLSRRVYDVIAGSTVTAPTPPPVK